MNKLKVIANSLSICNGSLELMTPQYESSIHTKMKEIYLHTDI